MMENIIIFALSGNKEIAKKVAKKLNIVEGKVDIRYFADGEVIARPIDSVRGKQIYIIQSTYTPVAERTMELLIFIDALKRAEPKHICAVIPYLGYSRQDRIARPGEPISAKLIADLLDVAGVDNVITIDLHTPQTQGFFSCPVLTLSAVPLFGEYFRNFLKKKGIEYSDVVVVSPDHGSAARGRDLATEIPNSTLAIIDKRRPHPNKAEVVNIVGEVKNKVCIIIDDIIDTGGTVIAGSEALKNAGAKEIYVVSTHGVFSTDEIFKCPFLNGIVVTDSIDKGIKGTQYISIAPLIAEVIDDIENNKPIKEAYLSTY